MERGWRDGSVVVNTPLQRTQLQFPAFTGQPPRDPPLSAHLFKHLHWHAHTHTCVCKVRNKILAQTQYGDLGGSVPKKFCSLLFGFFFKPRTLRQNDQNISGGRS